MESTIEAWLEREGRSKAWLAGELGMSRPTLYARLEDGRWALEEARKIARLMGVTVDELAGEEGRT